MTNHITFHFFDVNHRTAIFEIGQAHLVCDYYNVEERVYCWFGWLDYTSSIHEIFVGASPITFPSQWHLW